MTDIDSVLAANPPAVETAVTVVATVRRCRRHDYSTPVLPKPLHDSMYHWLCSRCGRPQDPIRSRRGKSASRRGKDYERVLSQKLGGTKVGHHGGPEDVRAGMFNVQSKVRAAFPTWMTTELAKLPRTGGRIPLLVVAQAGATRNAIVVIGLSDWIDLHGVTQPVPSDV